MSSPKACLLVSTSDLDGLLVGRIGSDDWLHADATSDHEVLLPIDQIVVFGGKIIALDADLRLNTVHLDEARVGISIPAQPAGWGNNNGDVVNNDELVNARLVVVCGDEHKLALVASPSSDCDSLSFFYLDSSTSKEPGRWSPVPDLDCALFISGAYETQAIFDARYGRQALSRPDGRGGRRGHVTFAGHGHEVYPFDSGPLLPFWVSPDVLSLDG